MNVIKQIMKMTAQNIVLPVCYRLSACKRVRPYSILFADAHHNSRPQNMDTLYYAVRKSGKYHISQIYLDYRDASFLQVLRSMLRFMRVYAVSQTVVLCDNFLPAASCRGREETLVVQLWHACGAMKKFGYDTEDDIPAMYHGHVYRNTRLVTVSAPKCEAPFASAMRLDPHYVQSLGVCRTDLFFRKRWAKLMQERFLREYPGAEGKRVIAIAPTFRGSAGAPKPYELDVDRLQKVLGDGYFVLLSLHPHMRPRDCDLSYISRIPTQELYPVADVLISDYSSLVYEYLLYPKPLILFTADLDTYRDQRGFYMDPEEIPAITVKEEDALAEAVRKTADAYAAFRKKRNLSGDMPWTLPEKECMSARKNDDVTETEIQRRLFLSEYMSACDGNSTKRVFEKIEEHADSE